MNALVPGKKVRASTKPLRVFRVCGMRSECSPSANGGRQTEEIVAARSKTEAMRILGVTPHNFNDYGSETGNQEEVALALSSPGTVFWKPLDSRDPRDWRVVVPGLESARISVQQIALCQDAIDKTEARFKKILAEDGPKEKSPEERVAALTEALKRAQWGTCEEPFYFDHETCAGCGISRSEVKEDGEGSHLSDCYIQMALKT